MKAGRTEEALRILGNLRADGDASNPRVVQEYEDIVEIVALERKHAGRNTYFAMLLGTGASPSTCEIDVHFYVHGNLGEMDVWKTD